MEQKARMQLADGRRFRAPIEKSFFLILGIFS
jgi:hypothetical protein